MRRAVLAPERMTTPQLWECLKHRLLVIEPGAFVGTTYKVRRTAWEDATACVRELELRGVQLGLPLGE